MNKQNKGWTSGGFLKVGEKLNGGEPETNNGVEKREREDFNNGDQNSDEPKQKHTKPTTPSKRYEYGFQSVLRIQIATGGQY